MKKGKVAIDWWK